MSILKKSNKNFNLLMSKKFLSKKNYLLFLVNNKNKFVHNFVYKKLNDNFISSRYVNDNHLMYLYILIDLHNYTFVKKKIKNLLNMEFFSYKMIGVKFGKNLLTLDFFEKNFLLKQDKMLLIKDLFLFNYISFITYNILLKKKLFIILNLFFTNFNLFKFNAYYTPSSK